MRSKAHFNKLMSDTRGESETPINEQWLTQISVEPDIYPLMKPNQVPNPYPHIRIRFINLRNPLFRRTQCDRGDWNYNWHRIFRFNFESCIRNPFLLSLILSHFFPLALYLKGTRLFDNRWFNEPKMCTRNGPERWFWKCWKMFNDFLSPIISTRFSSITLKVLRQCGRVCEILVVSFTRTSFPSFRRKWNLLGYGKFNLRCIAKHERFRGIINIVLHQVGSAIRGEERKKK